MNNNIIGTMYDARCRIIPSGWVAFTPYHDKIRNKLKKRGMTTRLSSMKHKVYMSIKIPPMQSMDSSTIKIKPYKSTITRQLINDILGD